MAPRTAAASLRADLCREPAGQTTHSSSNGEVQLRLQGGGGAWAWTPLIPMLSNHQVIWVGEVGRGGGSDKHKHHTSITSHTTPGKVSYKGLWITSTD